MAEIPKEIKASETSVTQEIDLNELTGVDVSKDPVLAREMQQAVIDYMIGRVSEGKGFNEKVLRPSKYSDSYADSLDFKAAGKSKGNVNMELSGDMLGSIDVIDETNNGARFTFGIEGEEAARAYGHISGFKGHPNQDKMQKYQRPFFGVSKKEIKDKILPAFKDELESLRESRSTRPATNNARLLENIRSAADLFGEDE